METNWTFEELDFEGALKIIAKETDEVLALHTALNRKVCSVDDGDSEIYAYLRKWFFETSEKLNSLFQVEDYLLRLVKGENSGIR